MHQTRKFDRFNKLNQRPRPVHVSAKLNRFNDCMMQRYPPDVLYKSFSRFDWHRKGENVQPPQVRRAGIAIHVPRVA